MYAQCDHHRDAPDRCIRDARWAVMVRPVDTVLGECCREHADKLAGRLRAVSRMSIIEVVPVDEVTA